MRFYFGLLSSVLFLGAPTVMAQSTFMEEPDGLVASAPETTIESAPLLQTNQNTAVFKFSFTGGEGYGGLECSFDNAAYSTCYSPYTRRNLADNAYKFCVRGVDATGAKDSTPACHEWTVDTKPPDVTITNPSANAGVFTKDPEIRGMTSEPLCEVHIFVGDKDVGQVTSNDNKEWVFSGPLNLSNGSQSLSATELGRAGNVSARSATTTVNVSTDPPKTAIVEHPEQLHRSHNAVFEFSSPTGAKQFECQLDNAPGFTACDEVWLLKKLESGPHTLLVRAKDSAGNVDPAPLSHTWTVDPQAAPSICSPAEPQAGCASTGGNPTLALGLLGGVLLVLTARRRRSS